MVLRPKRIVLTFAKLLAIAAIGVGGYALGTKYADRQFGAVSVPALALTR